jgi:hypothetical protein
MKPLPVLPLLIAVVVPVTAGAAPNTQATSAADGSSRLTLDEAKQAIRRKTYRRARADHWRVDLFEIAWCKRRAPSRVGCRFRVVFIDTGGWDRSCTGGARVTEEAGIQRVEDWTRCIRNGE